MPNQKATSDLFAVDPRSVHRRLCAAMKRTRELVIAPGQHGEARALGYLEKAVEEEIRTLASAITRTRRARKRGAK